MIVLENVTKTYLMGETTVHALRGVSLRIERGEFVSLVGASGSGKSTLLHMIGLLDRPDTGILRIGGHDTATLSDDDVSKVRSETIGFVFQQFHLLKRMTAFDNVELPLIYAKGDRPSADPADLLDRVGLGERSHHRPNELSGGQQQRVAIARALVRRPLIVLADEPTGNLDSKSGAEIMALLRELHAEGLTIVLVTHEPSIAAAADRTIRVHDGQIVEDIRKPDTVVHPEGKPITAGPELKMSRQLRWDLLLLNFQQAARGLWANKLRTCLSALGIIIGVAAVIVVLALGHSTQESVSQRIQKLGANKLYIIPNYQNTAGVRQKAGAISRLTVNDALSIKGGRLDTVEAVSGGTRATVQVVYGHNNASTDLYGAFPGYASIYDSTPPYGRFFTEEEARKKARVAVLGTTLLTELFGRSDPIGQTIQINHIPFTVIGVLPSKGSDGQQDMDDRVVIPLQTAMYRVLGQQYVGWIDVTSVSSDEVEATQKQLLDLTHEWPQIPNVTNGSYQVISMKSVTQALSGITLMLSLLLAGVAAVSLVVGGIGIMNIMLVSVTERTREIGLRKALGARGKDIQTQFLIEAITLCLSGGFLGIAFGWIVSLTVGYFQGVWMSPTFISIALSCGFSVAVGIGFGYWPAVLASRLDPIEALRYE
jgi:macrolide transport system ATP-binding/permease protein